MVAFQSVVPRIIGYYHLFTETGLLEAHARLQDHYARVGRANTYTGQFYPGPHKFDLEMQLAAFQ